jgi:hypothetical protein
MTNPEVYRLIESEEDSRNNLAEWLCSEHSSRIHKEVKDAPRTSMNKGIEPTLIIYE